MSGPSQGQIAALTARAVEAIRLEHWDRAEHTVGQLLKLSRRDPDGLHMMGLVRIHQGNVTEAEAFFRHALRHKPDQVVAHISLARLLAQSGRTPQAIAHLRGAIRNDPASADLPLLLGQLQQAAGETQFAERNLLIALRLRPDDTMAVMSLSGLYIASGRLKEAEAILRAALARDLPPPVRAALERGLAEAREAP